MCIGREEGLDIVAVPLAILILSLSLIEILYAIGDTPAIKIDKVQLPLAKRERASYQTA